MEQLKCKNCGASIEHLYNHKCPYCRSFIDFNVKQTEDINPRYMYDVEIQGIENDFRTNRIIMYFRGKYLKASEALEYTNNNTLMKVDYECLIPKDVRYAISFDKAEFHNIIYGQNYEAVEILLHRFPFELDSHKLIEALIEFKNGRYRL